MTILAFLEHWRGDPLTAPNFSTWRTTPPRSADLRPFPVDLLSELSTALTSQGITMLYRHQLEAWQTTRSGRNVVLATGNASGKTGYENKATFKCNFNKLSANTYLVEANMVGDYYTGGSAEDVLVVYDPSLGFTTAGGWFYWSDITDKTNFGYAMKYNKKGNKVQGSLFLIRHTAEGNYQVKSNALFGLALNKFDAGQYVGLASFSGKCT
jgi:hypothetical protein